MTILAGNSEDSDDFNLVCDKMRENPPNNICLYLGGCFLLLPRMVRYLGFRKRKKFTCVHRVCTSLEG